MEQKLKYRSFSTRPAITVRRFLGASNRVPSSPRRPVIRLFRFSNYSEILDNARLFHVFRVFFAFPPLLIALTSPFASPVFLETRRCAVRTRNRYAAVAASIARYAAARTFSHVFFVFSFKSVFSRAFRVRIAYFTSFNSRLRVVLHRNRFVRLAIALSDGAGDRPSVYVYIRVDAESSTMLFACMI